MKIFIEIRTRRWDGRSAISRQICDDDLDAEIIMREQLLLFQLWRHEPMRIGNVIYGFENDLGEAVTFKVVRVSDASLVKPGIFIL